MGTIKTFQLCWDCAKATGGCDWSREFLPIPGWDATPAVRNGEASYVITGCPEFERDAWNKGSSRKAPSLAEVKAQRRLEYRREKGREYYARKVAQAK